MLLNSFSFFNVNFKKEVRAVIGFGKIESAAQAKNVSTSRATTAAPVTLLFRLECMETEAATLEGRRHRLAQLLIPMVPGHCVCLINVCGMNKQGF